MSAHTPDRPMDHPDHPSHGCPACTGTYRGYVNICALHNAAPDLAEALRVLIPVADAGLKALNANHLAKGKPPESRFDMMLGALDAARAALAKAGVDA